MYSYIKAVVKPKGKLSRWMSLDVSKYKLRDILNNYLEVKIEIDTPSFEGKKYHLRKDSFFDKLIDTEISVEEWLLAIGNYNPILHEGEAVFSVSSVVCYDIWASNFAVSPYMIGQHPDTDWNPEDIRDLIISRDKTDYKTMERHCLATVNGLIHRTSSNEHGFIIKDGAFSKNLCNRTSLSIIDFFNVGEVEIIDLNSDMAYKPDEDTPLFETTLLNTGVDFKGKTPIFVLGGYLHLHDRIFNIVGDGIVRVAVNKLPLVERYYESHLTIDLSSLPVTSPAYDYNILQGGNSLMMAGDYYLSFSHPDDEKEFIVSNPAARYVNEIKRSDEYIKAYLDLSQSFIVLVDTESLYRTIHVLEKSGINGLYYHQPTVPLWPMVSPSGKFNEYIRKLEDGVWVLNCENGLTPNYIMHTTEYENDTNVVTPNREPSKPNCDCSSYLLEIGTEK